MSANSSLGIKPYNHGLHDLGNGGYAWLQPDGGWGQAEGSASGSEGGPRTWKKSGKIEFE